MDRVKILLIDDDESLLFLTAECFKDADFIVETAENGEEGLTKYSEFNPDIVVVDSDIPVMNGVMFCQKVKMIKSQFYVPVIMLTGNLEMDNKLSALENGADDYVSKPMKFDELYARVNAQLRVVEFQKKLIQTQLELDNLNQHLEQKVEQQVEEIQRINHLRRYLPKNIVDQIISKDSCESLGDTPEKKELTVLFSDLRGFTSYCEKHSSQEIKVNSVKDTPKQ